MDKRLQDIQHGTLTESRLNSDFLFWLKTKGPNYLLLAMVVLCGFMAMNWWDNRNTQARDGAWNEMRDAKTPQSLVEVANKHSGTDSISELATLNAADSYMQAIQTNKRIDREDGAADAAVTPELRTEYLAEADRLYAKVVSEVGENTSAKSLLAITALFGRAAICETKNDPSQAAQFLTQAQQMAQKNYPQLAKIADNRKQTLPELAQIREMPSRPVDPNAPATSDAAASTQNLLMAPQVSAPAVNAPASVDTPTGDATAPAAPK